MSDKTTNSIVVECKVKPKSSRQKIVLESDGSLKIFLHSAPEDNKANCELRRLIGEKLRISQSCVEIIRGSKSKSKLIRISGASLEILKEKLSS
ncbi:MAG TPA: DUF167 domain-containing protein [Victivallales bacterium]|nr:DUF167 domain-containing protein [Victivallales bacterium]